MWTLTCNIPKHDHSVFGTLSNFQFTIIMDNERNWKILHSQKEAPVSWQRNPCVWNKPWVKWQSVSSSLMTWTGKKVPPWARHRSLSFKPWRNRWRPSLRKGDFLPLDSTFLYTGPFQHLPPHSSCNIVLHIFSLLSSGPFTSSYWFAHFATPSNTCSYI